MWLVVQVLSAPIILLAAYVAWIVLRNAWRWRGFQLTCPNVFTVERRLLRPLMMLRDVALTKQLFGDEALVRFIPGLEESRRFGVQVFTAHNGQEHVLHRRLVAASMRKDFTPCLAAMVEKRTRSLTTQLAVDETVADVFGFMTRFVSGSIAQLVYGSTAEEREAAKARIPQLARILSFVAPVWMQNVLELVLPAMKRVKEARELVDKLNAQMIRDFEENGAEATDCDSMLYLLYRSNQDGDTRMLLRDVCSNAGIFSAGGIDSLASVLCSSFFVLCQHPEMQEELVQEDEFLRNFVKEVLRHYPPFPVVGFRYALSDYAFGKQIVPAGVCVSVDMMALQMDVEFWGPDAKQFRPSRWSEKLPENHWYFPWGGGPRLCVGKPLALAVLYAFIRQVCVEFRLEFASGTRCEPGTKNPLSGVTSPEKPLAVRFVKRR